MSSPRNAQAAMASESGILDPRGDLGDEIKGGLVLAHEALGLVDSVNDGGVVAAAEETGNGRVAELGHVPEDVHRDLAG